MPKASQQAPRDRREFRSLPSIRLLARIDRFRQISKHTTCRASPVPPTVGCAGTPPMVLPPPLVVCVPPPICVLGPDPDAVPGVSRTPGPPPLLGVGNKLLLAIEDSRAGVCPARPPVAVAAALCALLSSPGLALMTDVTYAPKAEAPYVSVVLAPATFPADLHGAVGTEPPPYAEIISLYTVGSALLR